jgi:hypothetical protein
MTDYRRTDPKDWPRPTPRHKDVMADMSEDMRRFLRAAMDQWRQPRRRRSRQVHTLRHP